MRHEPGDRPDRSAARPDWPDPRSAASSSSPIGFCVGHVEAQPLTVDQRAFLRHMRPEHLAQGLVQQVGRRMVGSDRPSGAHDRPPPRAATPSFEPHPSSTATSWTKRSPSFFARVGDPNPDADGAQKGCPCRRPGRPTRRRRVSGSEGSGRALPRGEMRSTSTPPAEQRRDQYSRPVRSNNPRIRSGRPGREWRTRPRRSQPRPNPPTPGGRRRAAAAPSRLANPVSSTADGACPQRLLRQVERKTVGVVELERDIAAKTSRRSGSPRVSSSRIDEAARQGLPGTVSPRSAGCRRCAPCASTSSG